MLVNGQYLRHARHFCSTLFGMDCNPYPLSTSAEAGEGLLNTGSDPPTVLGNAMTSRILFAPARIAINLSKPTSQPRARGVSKSQSRRSAS